MARRVVLLGITDLTARCLELLERRDDAVVEAIAVPGEMVGDESAVSTRLRELAGERGIPVVDAASLARRESDLGISVGFPQILGTEVIDAFSGGMVNLHLAPLPRYRGSLRTLSAAILDGEETFGVSLHRIDAGIDTGEVLRVREFPLPPRSTAQEILPLLTEQAHVLFAESVDLILSTGRAPDADGTDADGTGPTETSRVYLRSEFDELLTITVPVTDDELDVRRRALTWSDDVRPRLRTRDGTEIPSALDLDAAPADPVDEPAPEQVGSAVLAEGADHYFDPVWQRDVALSALEHELLQHPLVRRLAHVAHAGASSVLSPQTYSRLDHSLGLLTLAGARRPDDRVFRAAALVHDLGHTPLSHTVEKALGLDHHALGDAVLLELAPVFERHGLRADDVVAATHGAGPSGLGSPGAMRLDHVESFVRSAHVHGRLAQAPRHLLDRLHEVDGQVSCSPATARLLVRLAVEEAQRQTSCSNARANAVAGRLVRRRAAGFTAAELHDVSRMTDRQLWSLLAEDEELAPSVELLLTRPEAWECRAVGADEPVPDGWSAYDVDRLYFEPPLVDGHAPADADPAHAVVHALPRRFVVSQEPTRSRTARRSAS